jgi:hypothetical protein
MAEQNVVIKIQADVSKATNDVKALQQVIAKLSTSGTQAAAGTEKVSNAAKKTATASQLLDKEIKKVIAGQGDLNRVAVLATQALAEQEAVAKRLAGVSKAVEGAVGKKGVAVLGASKQVGGLADASGAASFALLSLGQAFQDSAQFGMGFAQGFRAINNNIQQTFTAIALGSIQAGGFNNLLKLMGGSLWGPGGLILGFSALTAAVEFFSTRAQKAKKETEELSKSFDGLFSSIQVGSIQSTVVGEESALRMIKLYLHQKQTGDEFLETVRSQGVLNAQNRKDFEASAEAIDRHNDAIRLNIKSREADIEAAKEQNRILYESIQALGVDGVIGALRSGREEWEKTNGVVERAEMIFSAGFGTEAEFNKGFKSFSQSLSDINPKIKITEKEFAKLSEKGGLDKFLADQQWKVTVKNLDSIKKESEGIAKAWEKILGVDGRMTIADLADKQRIRLIGRGENARLSSLVSAIPGDAEAFRQINERYREYVDNANALTDANQQIRESMAQVASDLLVSFATMGGGFDMFLGTMGRFMSKYGAEMIAHGTLTALLGVSIERVKEALATFQGKKAIVAGLALVAIGSRLRSNARNASRRLQGGGGSASSGRFTAPSFGAMSMVPTIGQGSVFQSQQFSPVPQGSQNVQLVASGRSLVSVVGSEMSASSRRVGGTPVSFSGVTAASGVFVDINRDDLVK